MKKFKKMIVVFMAVAMMSSLFAVSTSAFSYEFYLPYPKGGSLRCTELHIRDTWSTPYVSPSFATTRTVYYLSKGDDPTNVVTRYVRTGSSGRHDFTWIPGLEEMYKDYKLCGYPDVSGSYNGYTVQGQWDV